MNFTKDELRIIETLACRQAFLESQGFIELATKTAMVIDGKPNELSMKYFSFASSQYDKLMTLAVKAGKMSEGLE